MTSLMRSTIATLCAVAILSSGSSAHAKLNLMKPVKKAVNWTTSPVRDTYRLWRNEHEFHKWTKANPRLNRIHKQESSRTLSIGAIASSLTPIIGAGIVVTALKATPKLFSVSFLSPLTLGILGAGAAVIGIELGLKKWVAGKIETSRQQTVLRALNEKIVPPLRVMKLLSDERRLQIVETMLDNNPRRVVPKVVYEGVNIQALSQKHRNRLARQKKG